MKNKKLLFLKSLAIMLFAFCLQTPECSAKGNPAGKAIKKVGKAVGGSVKKAKKLLGDVKKIFKCIAPIGKAFATAAKNPKKGKKALQSINKCMKSVKDFSKTCDSPAMLALTAVPEVGSQLSHGCGVASKYEGKYDSMMQKVEQAESVGSAAGVTSRSKKQKDSDASDSESETDKETDDEEAE
jgi:hypothetical protein